MRRFFHIIIPLLILILLAAPSVTFLLPATQDYLDEIYQPLQALKFFKTRGTTFHKYAPFPNFVLAPGYGASLAYWKVTGSFARPSDKFPFGFSRPFEQMGILILQGRVLFLIIGVIGIGYLAHTLELMTKNRAAIGFALLFCLASNYALVQQIPSPRPDSPMLGFSALALAVYLRLIFLGFTVRRGVWFSLWAAFAVSSKELAAPLFVMPYLGLIWIARRESNGQRTIRWSFITGVVSYALINIVYAPKTWRERMYYWLAGPGIDADVWAAGSPIRRFIAMLGCLLDNFGPGGAIVVLAALIAFFVVRPRRWIMLILPALSVITLGLAKLQYPADRFYTILALALFPVIACGLSAIVIRRPAIVVCMILAAINVYWATFSWHNLHGTFEYVVERHAIAHAGKEQRLYMFNNYPWNPGSTRLDWLGWKHDPRSIQQIAMQRTQMPDWIYATRGMLQFIEDARALPARAAMIKRESEFDVATWNGVEGLGYRLNETIVPTTPPWFIFDWMPAVKEWQKRRTVLVYSRLDK